MIPKPAAPAGQPLQKLTKITLIRPKNTIS